MLHAETALKSQQNMDYNFNQKLGADGAVVKPRVQPMTQRKLNANRYSVDAANPNQRGLYADTKRSSLAKVYDNTQGSTMLPDVRGKPPKPGDSSYLASPAMDLSHDTLASVQPRLQQRKQQMKLASIQSTAEAHSRAMQ